MKLLLVMLMIIPRMILNFAAQINLANFFRVLTIHILFEVLAAWTTLETSGL